MAISDRADVKAVLDEARAKLAACGVHVVVSSNVLPGAGMSLSLFLAEADYDVQAAYVAQGDGAAIAHQNRASFAERVAAAAAEWAITKASNTGESA